MALLDITSDFDLKTDEITLTPSAARAVRELIESRGLEGHALRVYVAGGGCSGYQYGMALEGQVRETDRLFETDGIKVVVDEVSISYLSGAIIDYVDELMGSGFKIENPNAVASCGCGHSFRTREESAQSGTAGADSCC